MAGPPWFYFPFNQLDAELLEISGEEANHILGARRMRPGDEVALSNGMGQLAHCTLESINKREKKIQLRISLVARLEAPAREITLASAIPKGDRLGTMLDMCCQLGMTGFQPLEFEYSVTRWNDKIQARCDRILVEACKQSKTAWKPKINTPRAFTEFINERNSSDELVLLADQFGSSLKTHATGIEEASGIVIVVGPEGGLSETEIKLTQDGEIAPVRLADSVLRVETAAAGAVAAVQALL